MKSLALFSLALSFTAFSNFAYAAGMDDIIEPGTEVKKLAGDLGFTEGPVWISGSASVPGAKSGTWIFSDIPGDTLHQITPAGEISQFRKPSGHTNGNTLDPEGRLVSCEHDGRMTRTEKD